LFKNKFEGKISEYLNLLKHNFNDKDVDYLIEHFRDKDRRKEFFKEYKEVEMLYEIISPDAFLRAFIESYTTFAAMYKVVRKAYTKKVYVDREFQRKTCDLVKEHVDAYHILPVDEIVEINEHTIDIIKRKQGSNNTKIINLVKSIEKMADEQSNDPFLIAMAERAKLVQGYYEDRQKTTSEALDELIDAIRQNEERKKEQSKFNLDHFTFFLFKQFQSLGFTDAKEISEDIKCILSEHPDWSSSEKSMREVRKKVTFRIYKAIDDIDKVALIVDDLFSLFYKLKDKS
ncbi:MAG: type I restriction endonuclease subunit R, partial [Desulfobacterales bacterium]|nr:type I restriction endonuclease subunit R [Desulfobacterales bacterium]